MKSRILTDPSPFNGHPGFRLSAMAFGFFLGGLVLAAHPAARAQQGPTAPMAANGATAPPQEANPVVDVENRKKISPDKPVNITSDRLNFDKLNGLTLFNGSVKVVHDEVTLNSDEVQASASNRVATALGHVRVNDLKSNIHLTCGNLDYHDLMDQITAHDHPVLDTLDENGMPLTIRSRQMELYTQQKRVVAHQDVEILHDGGRSEAQLATFDAKTNQLVLEENPRIFMPQGVIAGRRITTTLTGDHRFIVEGMAEAEFYSQPQAIPSKPSGNGTSTPLGPGMGVTTSPASSPGSGTAPASGIGPTNFVHSAPPGGGPVAVPPPGL
jgi:lipopolysaccharide export system protein LptA